MTIKHSPIIQRALELDPERELSVLYRISHRVARRHEVSSLLNDVLSILEEEIGVERAAFALRRFDSDVFVVEAACGMSEEERRRGEYAPGEGIVGRVVETGAPVVVEDISKEPLFLNKTKYRPKDKTAFLCVPVIHQRAVIGTMSIYRPTATMDALNRELHFFKLIGDILAEGVAGIREEIEERESLQEENLRLRQQLGEHYNPGNMIGRCGAMLQVYDQIAQVADSVATVLIRGESGTGKELVARAIHYSSSRRANPFVCVNCAALPENLIESELFGHEKGSFSGATRQRKGRFEAANGGTLFLDEIGDIAPSVQVRLLRALQERVVERVGSNEPIPVNVRIIAATSRDLEEAMAEGAFREDLYYRLNVFPIHLPALRDRRSDIMLLADSFIQKYNEAYGKNVRRISTAAINMMMAYHWPGNVRELENCIERAVLTSQDDVIHGYGLPPSLQTDDQTNTPLIPRENASLKELMDSYEREVIIDALKRHRGNVAAAARVLQTTPRIIHYAIKRLGIQPANYAG